MQNVENQKVVVCGGAANPALREIPKYVQQNKTYYIGVDAGSLQLIKAGYQLDYAVGDFDSVTEEEFQLIKENTSQIIKHPAQKDDTDMELALEIVQSKYPSIDCFIFGGIGETKGRLDHMLANIWMVYQPRFKQSVSQIKFIEKDHVFQFYFAGLHTISADTLMPDYLSIITLTAVKELSIENAIYNLEPTDIPYPRALISNEFIDENHPVIISFKEGLVLVLRVNER